MLFAMYRMGFHGRAGDRANFLLLRPIDVLPIVPKEL